MDMNKEEFVEVSIPVPWGTIAGKWWGPTNVRPVLCVHGVQDNAGSFDRIIPLLPNHIGYLAIDFPGHGRSSWLPSGVMYNVMDLIFIFKIIKNEYKWDKLSVMGHSLGGLVLSLYAGIYPDDIDLFIGIDTFKAAVLNPDELIDKLRDNCNQYLKNITLNAGTEPPAYMYEEMIRKLVSGSNYSLTSATAHYLIERGSNKSKTDPNKFCFSVDNAIKSSTYRMVDNEVIKEMARRMKFPVLYFKGKDSPFFEDVKYRDEVMRVLQDQNPKFEYYLVEGRHHIHITNVEGITTYMKNFINKYRPPSNEDKIGGINKIKQSKL